MPTTKSAKKRMKTNLKARLRNRARKSEIKTIEKKLRVSVETGNKEETLKLLSLFFSKLDKAVKTGVIHKNKARRKKSRLSMLVNKKEKDFSAA